MPQNSLNHEIVQKRALLVINRESRRGKEDILSEGKKLLHDRGFEFDEIFLTRDSDQSSIFPNGLANYDLIIIGGGDGTLNRLANNLCASGLPIGIIPLGTGNDLCRTLAIPFNPTEACKIIADGNRKKIDLGRVNGTYFFNVASMGISTRVTKILDPGTKIRWGPLAYIKAFFYVIHKYRPFTATIITENESVQLKSIQIAVGNGRYYGGGLVVADFSTIDNHQLVVYSIKPQELSKLMVMAPLFLFGKHIHLEQVVILRGKKFEIRTSKTMKIDTDGELIVQTPSTFEILPDALEFFVPAGEGLSAKRSSNNDTA